MTESTSRVARPLPVPAPESLLPRTLPGKISCIVCAYNEAERIGAILEAVSGHPALVEVIVVNDGSTDATAALLAGYPNIRVISYASNRGKTYALSRGIAVARGEYLMLLDADLAGVRAADIQALADPVIDGLAQVSISLRANSLMLYRAIGLDFVSGERVIPARLGREAIAEMRRLPRWGGEAFLNRLIVRDRLSLAVVKWPGVFNIRKHHKVGAWRGMAEELKMTLDATRVLSPWGLVAQNLSLLSLVRGSEKRQSEMSWTRSLNRRRRTSQ
ncbi:MAG TPA: glycosyltransferase family 2 protein [Caulobacteraceae bacterium]|jgi:glycosyltransferase involved in cell wall biosynthesis